MSNFHGKDNIYVSQVVLKVQDIDRSKEFYTDILGFKILEDKGREVSLTADGINIIIKLIQPKDIIPKIPRRSGLYHVAILLPNITQLGLFLKNIRDKSYPLVGGSNHGVSQAIYLEDPDDNGIEVYADTSSDSWKWSGSKVEMTSLPLDYDKLIEEAEGLVWNGMVSDTIIGHIHLHVADLDEAKRFYIEGIGLDLVSEISNSAAFLSSGGYHHHVAINIWNGRGVEALPANSVGMDYYTLNFPSEDIRSEKIDALDKLGYKIFQVDENKFVRDPSYNLIKLI